MSEENISNFIQSAGFSELQKASILALSDADERASEYVKVLRYRYMHDALAKQRSLNNYIIENRVFMTPELDEMLTTVSSSLANGLNQFEMGKRYGDYTLVMKGVETITGLDGKLPNVLKAIQNRLCHSAAETKLPSAS